LFGRRSVLSLAGNWEGDDDDDDDDGFLAAQRVVVTASW